MRGLAQYVMTGRRQAIIIVLLCGFFPLLYFFSAAVVGLVTLRKGRNEGLIILLWSLLPAGLMWAMGDVTPMVMVLGITIAALLLRRFDSWPRVILLATVIGLAAQVSLIWQPGYVAQMEQIFDNVIESQLDQGIQVQYTTEDIVDLLLNFYGAYHAALIVLCLMLARWWQSALYNPGGFRQEFHHLRFDTRIMILLLGLILGGLMDIPPLENWLPLFCVAPMFTGLAVAHYTVAKRNMGSVWLVLCYITLFLMVPAIILLGLSDSVVDYRKRLDRQNSDRH